MPTLRERIEDIPLLVNYFLSRAAVDEKKRNPSYRMPKFSNEAQNMLTAFNWPGNVRQLELAVLAALAICETGVIQPHDFPNWFQNAVGPGGKKSILQQDETGSRSDQAAFSIGIVDHSSKERSRYLKALNSTRFAGTERWNLSAAARKLGIPRKTFVYRLKKIQLI
jgi:DNA-binding NtrC family response regulator